jgi:cytochrome P450
MNIPPLVPRRVSIARAFRFLKNPIPLITQNLNEYGKTYAFHIGGSKLAIMTAEPAVIKHILQKNNKNYYKSEIQSKTVGYFIGNGLLTSNGPYWLQQRRLIQPGFHKKKLEAIFNIIKEEIDNFTKDVNHQESHDMDIRDAMQTLTFRVISKSIFSTGINEEELDEFRTKIDLLQEFIIKQVRLPFLTWYHKISGQKQKHKALADETKATMNTFIKERRNDEDADYDDLLDMLLAARYEDDGKGMTNKQIIEEALIIFVAGHETSSNALAWIFYLLSVNPEELEKLRAEIEQTIGNAPLKMEDLRNIDYSRMIIEEGMRIYPPAWIVDRVALEDDEVNGYKIPKGTMIAPFIYGVHHDPDIWEDPARFNPERFSKENKKEIGHFEYFPFGGGPRLCIGMGMAMMEMQMILIEFVRNFDFELLNPEDIKLKTLITLQPEKSIRMRVKKRH